LPRRRASSPRSADLSCGARQRACNRTVGPVTVHVRPLASRPLKFVCAVWADADALHQRVRIVVDPFAGI
jgi:hypothetical protein